MKSKAVGCDLILREFFGIVLLCVTSIITIIIMPGNDLGLPQ